MIGSEARGKTQHGDGGMLRNLRRALHQLIVIALASLVLVSAAAAQAPVATTPDSGSRHLRGGWYPWDPYQYRDYKRGVPILTGFDVEIERALARIMGVEIDLPEIAWKDHLQALNAGTVDIAAGATASEAAVNMHISRDHTGPRRMS